MWWSTPAVLLYVTQDQTINIDMGGEKGGSKRGLTFWRPNTRPMFSLRLAWYSSLYLHPRRRPCSDCHPVWSKRHPKALRRDCKHKAKCCLKRQMCSLPWIWQRPAISPSVLIKLILPKECWLGHRLFPPAWKPRGTMAKPQKGLFRRVKKRARGKRVFERTPHCPPPMARAEPSRLALAHFPCNGGNVHLLTSPWQSVAGHLNSSTHMRVFLSQCVCRMWN